MAVSNRRKCNFPIPLTPPLMLTLGTPALDRMLGGGLPCGRITEFVGESDAGKTQIAIQLLLMANLPISDGGLGGASIYIHAGKPFPLNRLRSMVASRPKLSSTVYNHVYIHKVDSIDELMDVICRAESTIQKLDAKLLVLDSMPSLFRSEFANNSVSLKRRQDVFFRLASRLKSLAYRYNLVIVVTNQVSDAICGPSNGMCNFLRTSGRNVTPSLGLSWAHCVNIRLFMSVKEGVCHVDAFGRQLASSKRRFLHVVFAPHLPEASSEFVITVEGVVGLD